MTVLVVTNDFPPRIGGIESFVARACRFLDDDVAVLTATAPGSTRWDADAGFPIVRLPGPLLPTPAVGAAAAALMRGSGANQVLFGAAAPLALLAPVLRVAGAERVVALTHGHETWWATLPGSRSLLRRIGDQVDVLTTISDYTTRRISEVLGPAARDRLVRLPPPVDLDIFRPATAGPGANPGPPVQDHLLTPAGPTTDPRDPIGAGGHSPDEDVRRVVSVGRMVRRKGFDTLLRAWVLLGPEFATDRRRELVLVGDGPERRPLERRLRRSGVPGVRWTGALDSTGVLAQLHRADVFALPIRSRLGGLDSEGLGLAALEAAACELPVVVGRSGGAPETVRHGHTGYVVDPGDPYELAARLHDLITDRDHTRLLGVAGRRYVAERYGADRARRTLRAALGLPDVATV